MNRSCLPEEYGELRRLIHALHEKTITSTERDQLEVWICRDKEARKIYAEYMNLYAALRWRIRQESEPGAAPPEQDSPASRTPILGFLGECFQRGTSFLPGSTAWLLVALIGLPALALALLAFRQSGQAPANNGPVATIVHAYDCTGTVSDSNHPLSVGTRLAAGQTVTLERGLVEIQFAQGARVILEERASLEVRGVNASRLTVGRLAATVPESAHGFTVETPAATVVDLGTDFGVSVDGDKTAEAHVFGGQIEVTTKATPECPAPWISCLREGQAARIRLTEKNEVAGIETITASSDDFVRQFPVGLPAENNVESKSGSPTHQMIASVDRRWAVSGNRTPIGPFDRHTDPLPSDTRGLRSGVPFYSDRVYTVGTVNKALIGADYVRTFNSDKFSSRHWYHIKLATYRDEVFLMVLVDDRIEKRKPGKQQWVVDQIVSRFARPGDFVDTGYEIILEEGPDGLRSMSAFGKMVPTKDASGKPIKYSFCASGWPPGRITYPMFAVLPEAPQP
ncbi:MAG: FecR domain-containing protein [Pirellulales bacterium]|nr:FecR domain-containing protein [Pirellulales bacterium]